MHKVKGFSVVELVIIVTVIGILMAISVFAFGSWRERTAETEVKSALMSLDSVLKAHLAFNNQYPGYIPVTYKSSDNVTINYTNTTTTYCAKGTNNTVTSVVWYISSANSTPTKTACS